VNLPRVLVYCPVAPTTPKIYGRTVQSIFGMRWPAPIDVVFGREDAPDPGRAGYLNVLDKYVHAREMALEGGYDALLTIEADMVVPPMALARLSQVQADVAYGLYCSRHGNFPWLAALALHERSAVFLSTARPDLMSRVWGRVIETKGVGLGCTFIWRHVLERIPFRCPDVKVANDWYFALDCQAAGFTQKTDCGVVCGHITMTPTPRVIWPTPDDPERHYRFEFLG
jgi:hypothetical protein